MPEDWQEVPLASLCTMTSGGTPSKAVSEYWGGAIPWISGASMHDQRISDSERKVTQAAVGNGTRLAPVGSTLVLVRGMALLEEVRIGHVVKEVAFNQDVKALIPDSSQVDPTFLTYSLLANRPRLLSQVHQAGHGTGVLGTDRLASLPISIPSREEQCRIAGVLGALDDLIEVNRRLISDLLETADAVAAATVQGDEVFSFADVCDVFGGGTPSTKNEEFWGGDVRWATPTDLTALPSPYLFDTSRRITSAGLEACASKLMPKGSILMTSRATIGAFAIAQEPTAVNQGFIAIEPRQEIDRWFLFHEMRRRVPEFIQRANGSTFLELSRGVFKGLEVNWPAESVRADLFAKVDPLHIAAASLQQEIAELQSTRDALLPLLMSGRVRVAEEVAA